MDDKKGLSNSFKFISEENIDNLYPIYFGISCAFFALNLLPEHEICDEKWSEIRNRMLKGNAHLLGLFIWEIQRKMENTEKFKLEIAQKEIENLKKARKEDAKANEKVVSIFAAKEQSWFEERKKLRQQIDALMNDSRVVETTKEKTISGLNEKLKENERVLQSKDKFIDEIQEELKKAENVAAELRENVENEARRHSSEILKHKTALLEIVSNQRRFEADAGRAFRRFEASKKELDLVLEQKEELVLTNQRLSMEIVEMHKDLEQKDQTLSAMLRKSRLDTSEKQRLLKEVKSLKAKRKQAEIETARWKDFFESKHERLLFRNMLSKHVDLKTMMSSDDGHRRSGKIESGLVFDPCLTDGTEKLTADVNHVDNREAEKHKITVEQMHLFEVDAFVEQLRLKDEKIEAFRWCLMSTELESKRSQSHIERLDREITQLRQDNKNLNATLSDCETELHSLKEQILHFSPPNPQKLNFDSSSHDAAIGHEPHDTVWSKVEVVKRKPGRIRQEANKKAEEIYENSPNEQVNDDIVLALEFPNKETKSGKVETEAGTGNSTWRMDVHAIGVMYKVKRLKQQLMLLERMIGKKESCEKSEINNGVKGFYGLMSVLNKQVDRYQSLQVKIDDLCMRMHTIARPEDTTKKLEQFLEETFQLQRYIVATGQKLLQVQAKITSSGFLEDAAENEHPTSFFDINRFADSIKALFREVQKGIEVRISRIIGDLEGTLACDGFSIHLNDSG